MLILHGLSKYIYIIKCVALCVDLDYGVIILYNNRRDLRFLASFLVFDYKISKGWCWLDEQGKVT